MINKTFRQNLIFSLGLSGLMFMLNYMILKQNGEKYIMNSYSMLMFNFLFGCCASIALGYLVKRNNKKKEHKL